MSAAVQIASNPQTQPRSGVRPGAGHSILTAAVLGVASLLLFFSGISTPKYLYYDESLYIDAAKALLAGAPDTNPEIPPMAKITMAGGILVFGDNPLGWRSMSAVFGASIVVAVFAWLLLLLKDRSLALCGAVLALLNNFIYVLSRIAMTDIFLIAFLMYGLVAFSVVLEIDELSPTVRRAVLALSGLMFGFASACKWNGVVTLGAVGLMSLVLLWRGGRSTGDSLRRYGKNLRNVGLTWWAISLMIVPICAYSLTFWPLCHNLGVGFSVKQLVDMNVTIWRLHRIDPGNPFIASKWYSWAFQFTPQRSLSYLVGNWFVMWAGVAALIYCARRAWSSFAEGFVVLLYSANLLQWAITPQKHLYYYYYFPAAMFLGVAIPIALARLPRSVCGVRLTTVCIVAASCVFLYCYPHMTHLEAPFDCALGCWS